MPVLQTRAEELSERGRCSERVLVAVRENWEEVGVKTDFVIARLFSCKEQQEEQWEGLTVWAVTAPEIYKYLCLDTVEDDLTKAGGQVVGDEQHREAPPPPL